jgi:hypothetical protein
MQSPISLGTSGRHLDRKLFLTPIFRYGSSNKSISKQDWSEWMARYIGKEIIGIFLHIYLLVDIYILYLGQLAIYFAVEWTIFGCSTDKAHN